MKTPRIQLRIGMRTLKTVAAVVLSMLAVDTIGMTDSRLIFAMLGATAALQPTFRESLESCQSQIVGVIFGALAGLVLRHLPASVLFNTGLGIALCITFYNALGIRFSPSLPIFMVVMLCTSPNIKAISYALGRIWDSAIGLGIGMLINMLVFPYDNSRQIRAVVKSLDQELLRFLNDLFDGDDIHPNALAFEQEMDDFARQLRIFSNQKLFFKLGRQRQDLERFTLCEQKASQLLAHLSVLQHIGKAGCLNEQNRRMLKENGAIVADSAGAECDYELNLVTNYHIAQILTLRRELLDTLGE